MDKADIGFFEEISGVLENKRKPVRCGADGYLAKKGEARAKKKGGPKAPKEEKSKALVTLDLHAIADPCAGCPLEGASKRKEGIGDPTKAKLLVVFDRYTEMDILSGGCQVYKQFLPLLLDQGFTEEDLYFVPLVRSRCGSENLDAINHCLHYLKRDVERENINSVLLLGLRPMQILINKDRSSIFHARADIFKLWGKPTLVTHNNPYLTN